MVIIFLKTNKYEKKKLINMKVNYKLIFKDIKELFGVPGWL